MNTQEAKTKEVHKDTEKFEIRKENIGIKREGLEQIQQL